MRIQDYKCKCGNDDFFLSSRGSQTGIHHVFGNYYCSKCGSSAPSFPGGSEWLPKFCPNCGERMHSAMDELIGRTIMDAEVDGYDVWLKLDDGSEFYYEASDGGYSTWEFKPEREEAEND